MTTATKTIEVALYTMCIVRDGDRVLLINRPSKRGFPGYIGPGGKVDFPESLSEGAAREVYEETGLIVKDLIYKGLDEFVDPDKNFRYMVFNYVATSFEGELLEHPPEGELLWVPIQEALDLPMQPWFKRRFPLFFEEGTFEIFEEWDQEHQVTHKEYVRKL
ncbi:DNA mismatch repair protein MutT [Paenibacillus selenitireducens]|uniref:DNA mismatch repair protein MutT n=1 Tax=Paenibacillus selenitireducens TaxID=1324314 RepID=A0A1T2XNB7_9BACL|nr:8-oxo-dGTP diphosphatase [Paenibacillus selenitireducens]OPA81236.1 DNA mismatch repair protein MutT [Paenibacillus selenitireducens]